MSVPFGEVTCPEKCPSIRSIDLKWTSPVKLTTSPTKPSQLSLLTLGAWPFTSLGWPRSSLLATAGVVTAAALLSILFLLPESKTGVGVARSRQVPPPLLRTGRKEELPN
jgi:hypothetical protein